MTNKTNPVGRPTKYTKELLADAEKYIKGGWQELGDSVPSIASMACFLGVRRETLHAWSKDGEHEVFSNIFESVLALQERELINRSLIKEFDSGMSKMMLTKHGYSDRQEIDHTTAGQPIQSTQDAVLAALSRKHSDDT